MYDEKMNQSLRITDEYKVIRELIAESVLRGLDNVNQTGITSVE